MEADEKILKDIPVKQMEGDEKTTKDVVMSADDAALMDEGNELILLFLGDDDNEPSLNSSSSNDQSNSLEDQDYHNSLKEESKQAGLINVVNKFKKEKTSDNVVMDSSLEQENIESIAVVNTGGRSDKSDHELLTFGDHDQLAIRVTLSPNHESLENPGRLTSEENDGSASQQQEVTSNNKESDIAEFYAREPGTIIVNPSDVILEDAMEEANNEEDKAESPQDVKPVTSKEKSGSYQQHQDKDEREEPLISIIDDGVTRRKSKWKRPDHTYQCGQCRKEYASLASLMNHIDTHANDGPRHKCPECGKLYTWERNLKEHLQTHKEGAPKHVCAECGKECASSRSLSKHLLTHARKKVKVEEMNVIKSDEDGRPTILLEKIHGVQVHRCSTCEKDFTTVSSLKIHLRTHQGEKPYKCDSCDKEFTQKGSLVLHRRTHTGEKPFQCSFCKKSFSQSGSLQTHLRTHSGDRPYQCEQCGKGFTQRGSLQAHLRTHTGYRPFKCKVCGRGFTQTGSLACHLRTHTGERPFSCAICVKQFSQQVALKKHLAKCGK